MSANLVPALNDDIMVKIMRFLADDSSSHQLSLSTLAAMSRTCKYMHFEGVRLLLLHTVVVLRRPLITSFCYFMLSDRLTRLPLLRRLKVNVREVTEDTFDLFSEVLHHAVNLYYLRIFVLDHPSLSLQVALCSLIASLTSVRHLVLGFVDDWRLWESFFRKILTPLSRIRILIPAAGESVSEGRTMYTRKRDPIYLLSRLKGTLESIDVDGEATLGSYICQYLHVEELRLPSHTLSVPIVRPVISSFPNLRDLYLGPADGRYSRRPHEQDLLGWIYHGKRTIRHSHDINRKDQQAHGTWRSLHSLRATIVDAYAFALSCHVERVHLLSNGGEREHELTMLSAILSHTQPSFLRLVLRPFNARGYIPIFRSTSWSANLETLELRINISKEEFDYEECFEHLAQLLSTMTSLASLRLELRCANTEFLGESGADEVDFSGGKCEPYSEEGYWWHCYTENALLREDLLQRVRDCIRASRSLRRMTLIWARCDAILPNRVIGIDLDNAPYSWDRPGDESDEPYAMNDWW